MPKLIDLTNKKFGFLTVIKRDPDDPKKWICSCDHGGNGEPSIVSIEGERLRSGSTKSCGCYRKMVTANNNKLTKTIHGGKGTRLYNIWVDIRRKCNDTNNPLYGGRGISMCEEWNSSIYGFINFRNWANESGYDDSKRLIRLNFDDNFYPANCRWGENGEESILKSNSRLIYYNGLRYTVSDFAKMINMDKTTVLNRLNNDWSVDDIVNKSTEETRKIRYMEHDGIVSSIANWGRVTGIGANILYKRLSSGWDFETVVTTKPAGGGFINALYYINPETGVPEVLTDQLDDKE